MNHLRIELSSTPEVVASGVVSRMYLEAYTDSPNSLDPPLNVIFKGSLMVPHAKNSLKTWLETKYNPDLKIIITDGAYMDFADPEVERICVANWGDGNGITLAQAAAVTLALWTEFTGNTNITSFDEFKYFNFSGMNWSWGGTLGFSYCTNLTSIDFGGKTFGLVRCVFEGCTSLVQIKNWNGTELLTAALIGCTSLTTINLSNVTHIEEACFKNCTSLDIKANGFDFSKIVANTTTNLNSTFWGVPNLGDVEMPNYLGSFWNTFRSSSITSISNCPNISGFGSYNNDWSNCWQDCSLLDTIDFSSSTLVTTIRRGMIGGGCPLLRIIKFPNSITTIGNGWINGGLHQGLRAIVFNSTTPPTWDDEGFLNYNMMDTIPSSCKIYVPDSTNDTILNAYKSTSGWSDYASIIYPMSLFAIDFPND